MATNTVDISAGSISTDKSVYRRYVQFGTITEGDSTKTIIKEQRIMQEAAAKDKKTGLAQNWQKAEDDGLELFNENEVISYAVNSEDAFTLLVPDAEQRLYIINAGLGNLQTSKAQSFMKAMQENTTEPTPLFDGVTLDVRVGISDDGEYSIQNAPQRRTLTDQQKLEKLLKNMKLSPDQLQAMLLSAASSIGE